MLFPNVFLPLHIFEPRYREMVTEALDGDRLIGMVLLRPGWEADYEGGRPSTRSAAPGSSRIPNSSPTAATTSSCAGWRSSGSWRRHSRSYRIAQVESLHEEIIAEDATASAPSARRLEALLVPQPQGRGVEPNVPPSMADEDLVNALAQYLELEPVEKQALLERDGLLARCRSLIELLEMKVIVSRRP